MPEEFSVGILLDSKQVHSWFKTALEEMLIQTPAEVELLVVNDQSDTPQSSIDRVKHNLKMGWNLGLWGLVVGLHRKIDRPDYFVKHSISDVAGIDSPDVVSCEPVDGDGFGVELPEDVVSEIGTRCDIVIRYGFGIITGGILDAPEHGVLSFHHGDIREYRGRPPGVWEFYHGEETAGVTLQRLTETLDGGGIVAFSEVDISDAGSWQEVERRLHRASDLLLANAIQTILEDEEVVTPTDLGDLYTIPDVRETLQLQMRNWCS